LIDKVQVELLDPHWLFAAHGDAAPSEAAQPVCALPEGDPWMEAMLRPLVESLGYRVVAAREGVAADILILSEESEGAGPVKAGQVVRLRSRPETGTGEDSIYRYDRAALIGALSRNAAKGGANG
jgi:two-component system chemotaxis sensor kinase CheA